MYVTYVVRCSECSEVTGICSGGHSEDKPDCWISRLGNKMPRDEAIAKLTECSCEEVA